MKLLKYLCCIGLCLLMFMPRQAQAEETKEIDVYEIVFGHIEDAYEWHITDIGDASIRIPLPVIVKSSSGWHIFSSARLRNQARYEGLYIAPDGEYKNKIVEKDATGEEIRPFDISITKNVLALFVNSAILVAIMLGCARWYKRHEVSEGAPKGGVGMIEALVVMINDEVIKGCIGEDYRRYAPYLLTVFFFVLMPMIELFGIFTKPFALMIRLFANIMAGHAAILSFLSIIFITVKAGPVINGSMTVISVLFGIFMDMLELLVAFIQAYVFTMLSAVFIGLSRVKEEN